MIIVRLQSIFVNAPTSTGKSLIYQLPAVLHRNRLTIVIEPTISLMLDQVQKLNRLGFAAAHLDSSLSQKQRQEVLPCLDQLTFLYTTPEQMIRSEFKAPDVGDLRAGIWEEMPLLHQLSGGEAIDMEYTISSGFHTLSFGRALTGKAYHGILRAARI